MAKEPAELCMICKAFGPINFECPHPDAHTPIANSYQDANGEPVEEPSSALPDSEPTS